MNPSVFQLSRLEFRSIDIEVNSDYQVSEALAPFPQLDFEFNKVKFELATALDYPDSEIDDPRHFSLSLKLSVRQVKQEDGIVLPYSVAIEGTAYLHFRGKDEGLNRFRAVRNTGYLMLYGAYREYIANFTSRSTHGLWFLPAPNFTVRAEEDAAQDVPKWEARKSKVMAEPIKVKRRVKKSIAE